MARKVIGVLLLSVAINAGVSAATSGSPPNADVRLRLTNGANPPTIMDVVKINDQEKRSMAKKAKGKSGKSSVRVRDIKARKDVKGGHKRAQAAIKEIHYK